VADLLKYRYVGERDAAGVPVLSLAHLLYGGIPARDLYESDVAALHEEQRTLVEGSPLYAAVTVSAARAESGEPPNTNRSSPGLPESQLRQVAPPGSQASGPTGEIPSGPPTDAEAQIEAEREMAAENPAVQDNPPPTRRRRGGS
jgi:hypothetical protein